MATFEKMYTEFENTKNKCKFFDDYNSNEESTKFLLIRSLDKKTLRELNESYCDDYKSDSKPNDKMLYKNLYDSNISIKDLLTCIESKRPSIIKEREQELDGLQLVIDKFPIVNCGVRNDKVDDIVKSFVRNKNIKSYKNLEKELDENVLPRIRQYSLWSYYNQTANDIIELNLLKNKRIIPTLRKIHDIDFFIKINNRIIPFDLKFTHISDSYFDLVSQGLTEDKNNGDDYLINQSDETSELKVIKKFYTSFKREHKELNLPNLQGLDKNTLCDILLNTKLKSAKQFVKKMQDEHNNYVPKNSNELKKLEWWNYKFQGERLFCNNNRLFIFLAYTNKFKDGRELKGKISKIGNRIDDLLNNLKASDIHEIHYHYDKEPGLTGDYFALSMSTIYYE